MTKSKVFLGLFAAAGAITAAILMKKRGQIKVEGALEAGNKPSLTGDMKHNVHGTATVRTSGHRQPQS
mgnify:CR=1 FL=1